MGGRKPLGSSVCWAHLGLVAEVTATCWWAVVLQPGVPPAAAQDDPAPTPCPPIAPRGWQTP